MGAGPIGTIEKAITLFRIGSHITRTVDPLVGPHLLIDSATIFFHFL